MSGPIVSPGRKKRPGLKSSAAGMVRHVLEFLDQRPLSPSKRRLLYIQIQRQVLAGIPIAAGLASLSRRGSRRCRRSLASMAGMLDSGHTLAEAAAGSPELFPEETCVILGAAEKTGKIPAILASLVRRVELQIEVRRSLIQALLYPVGLILAAAMLLPLPRLITCGSAAYLTGVLNTLLPFLLLAAVVSLSGLIFSHPRFNGSLRKAGRFIPLAGPALRDRALGTSLQTMGLAIDAGLGLPEAIRLAIDVAGHPEIAQIWERTGSGIAGGAGLAESLDTRLEDDIAVALSNGEKTGTLDQAFVEASEACFTRYADRIRLLGRIAGAIALVVVLAIVATSIIRSFLGVLHLDTAGDMDPAILKEIPGIFKQL